MVQAVGAVARGLAKIGPILAKGGKGAVELSKGFGKAATNASKIGSNLTNASRSLTGLIGQVSTFSNKWLELQDISFKTARSMGLSREEAMKMDRQLMQEIKEFGRAYGTSAMEIAGYQKQYSEATGRNIQLTKQQMEQMVALGNVTDSATASKLVEEFDTLGVNVEDTLAYTGQLQERAKYLGLNATKASKTLAENIQLAASHSFKNGVDDIQKMVLKSQSLKMNMQAIISAADKFSTIQSAIETSANIQMLGGSFAAQFSNPMGALYESMADPAAFQDRLVKTIAGKGTYDKKTNQVTFDPVTMMQMKEMAKQLGVGVEELTKPAMAMAQNAAVEKELRGQWSEEQKAAIQDLARANFDEKTGKHYVNIVDENGENQRVNVEDLTKKQLAQAQDSAMTQDKMWSDVHAIKEVLINGTMGRARQNRSGIENLKGYNESLKGWLGQLENSFMPTVSGVLNGGNGFFGNLFSWLGGTSLTGKNSIYGGSISGIDTGVNHYAEGGVVEPIQHATDGAIVAGDSYYGDNVPIMANSGEVVINKQQQSGLMNLLGMIGKIGVRAIGGNLIGKKLGLGNIGTKGLALSALSGGDIMTSMVQMAVAKKMGPLGAMIAGMDPISAMMFGGGGLKKLFGNSNSSVGKPNPNNRSIFDYLGLSSQKDIKGRKPFMKRFAPKTYEYFDKVLKGITEQFKKLGGKLTPVTEKIGKFGHKIGVFSKLAVRRGRNVTSAISHAMNPIKDILLKGFEKLKNTKIGRFGGKAVSMAKRVGSGIKSFGGAVSSDVSGIIGKGKAFARLNRIKGGSQAAKVLGSVSKTSGILGKTGTKLLGGLGKKIPGIGALLSVGLGAADLIGATSAYNAREDAIKNSNMSYADKQKAINENTDEKRGAQGKAIGSAVGGAAGAAIGGALGSFIPIPVLGTLIGTAVGGYLGDKVGGAIGSLAKPLNKMARGVKDFLFGEDKEKQASFSDEELADPQLTAKADLATIKIYELLLKNGDSGLIGNAGKTIGDVAMAPLKLATGLIGGIGNAIGSLIGTQNTTEISSLPVVGQRQNIKDKNSRVSNFGPSDIGPQEINLNVSGSIKLDLGGKQTSLDINKLLDSPQFKAQLTNIISRRLNDLGNGGKYNKEGRASNTQSMYNTVR